MQLKPDTILQGGKYRIIRTLGQGGFGITYEAEQVNLGRKVAIKEFFMREYCNRDECTEQVSVPSVGSQELVSRFKEKFLKEARLIGALDDAHIVRIHDVFEENGTAYYVMEHLSGGSLADKCQEGKPLSESAALKYIRQIASALEYLHSLPTPMNHLDIKPSNVLLNAKGEAVLIDFGISKRYDFTGAQTSSTPVGISQGYSPLEQYRDGGVRVFSPMTDIYSLGATLYKLVTGTTPPSASEVLTDGLPDLPHAISSRVRDAVFAAMQPRPNDRPGSIKDFLALLNDNETLPEMNPVSPSILSDESTIVNVGSLPPGKIGFVDLGLSVKWATCNLGASLPEDPGDYYAWGETESKAEYSFRSYKFSESLGLLRNKYVKYNSQNGNKGRIDHKTRLDKSDDAASIIIGNSCRIPTIEEFKELIEKCNLERTTYNGVKGLMVSRNGNSIFLPALGYKSGRKLVENTKVIYMSSSLYPEYPDYAWTFYCTERKPDICCLYRYYGFPIRSVKDL